MPPTWSDVSMCIVCAGTRWSRRAASAAPWLLVPVLVLWGVTQFFPKGWRIEVTSPRVLCVITLLSLAWYELALPRLKEFRARRKAETNERKRIQALEEARWRKVATRRCRNCLAAYEKQTPPGGKFMCTYCGHVSRKPVLDAPSGGPPNGGVARRGAGWPLEWCGVLKEALSLERCEKGQKLGWVAVGLWFVSWGVWPLQQVCRRFQVFREDEKGGEERGGAKGEGGGMSKEERARKKAEERLQARLEREALEAEELKQRQEVARLVEERRRERQQKLQAQREGEKEAEKERERERRREQEANRRRADKVRERQKLSDKENDKKPARTSSGEGGEKTARGNPPDTLREVKDREESKFSRPVGAPPTIRSPPVHLKSDVDAKTRAGIVKNGPVINVRTVQAKLAAAAKTNQSAPGVRPPAAGNGTTNAWANGPLPAVRKSVAAQKAVSQPGGGVMSARGPVEGENASGGAGSAWFGSAWATPWAKVAAGGTEGGAVAANSPAPKTPSAPQPARSWHSLFTRNSPNQQDPPPVPYQSNPPSPYALSPLGSPFGRNSASPPLPEDSTFNPPYGNSGLAFGGGVWGNGASSYTQFTPAERGPFTPPERSQFTQSESHPAPVGPKPRLGSADPLFRLVDDPWGTGVNSRFQHEGVNSRFQPDGVNGRYHPDGVNIRWDESGSSSGSSGKWRMWDTPSLEELIHTSAQFPQPPPRGGASGPPLPSRPLSADSVASSASSWSYRPGSARSQTTPPPENDAALKLAQHLEMLARSPGVSPSPPPHQNLPLRKRFPPCISLPPGRIAEPKPSENPLPPGKQRLSALSFPNSQPPQFFRSPPPAGIFDSG